MEAGSTREDTNRPEVRRATIGFVVFGLVLALSFSFTPDARTAVWGVGCLASALVICTAMRRNTEPFSESRPGSEGQNVPGRASRLLLFAAIIISSVLLFNVFDTFLAGIWVEVVPTTLSGFLEGMMQGGGVGILIYLLSRYDLNPVWRSMKVLFAVGISLLLFLAGIYVAIEYVFGPVVRFFA